MSDSKFNHCVVLNCKMSVSNKPEGITFHRLPNSNDMRRRWLSILKSRCAAIDWSRSRICSRHFDHKCIDSQGKLRANAVPTMFPSGEFIIQTVAKPDKIHNTNKTKVDRLLNKLGQEELRDDIKTSFKSVKIPDTFLSYVDDNLKCLPNTPTEIQLCLLMKKQDHLITRLTQQVLQNKKHVEVLKNNMEETRIEKNGMEREVESYKYIVKCLQERQTSLEEQVEILTSVESR